METNKHRTKEEVLSKGSNRELMGKLVKELAEVGTLTDRLEKYSTVTDGTIAIPVELYKELLVKLNED